MAIIVGNKIPMYSQIAQTIKQRVRTGVYKPGEMLPSVRAMGKEFGVSVKAVHQAVRTLEESGIVQTHPGKGMLVAQTEACDQAVIIFGLIHPYINSMGFHLGVMESVDDAFAERSNFVVVRSSKDNPVSERAIAEHLIANGAKGLIVWPTNNDPNSEFFMRLANEIPVVLVDRSLIGANLPTVVPDHYSCGREISKTILGKHDKKRLLVLMDNLQISSYQNILGGIESLAKELERMSDITVVQLPISELVRQISQSDFSEVAHFSDYIERLLKEGGYDAVFCTQDQFIDYCFAQRDLRDKFPDVQMATVRTTCPNQRSMKYSQLNCLEWYFDPGELILQAADIVQRWVLTRRSVREIVQVKFKLKD